METNYPKRNKQHKDDSQIRIIGIDQEDEQHYPIIQIEAEMKDGEDFPVLKQHCAVFMENNIVLFGGLDSNGKRNNVFHIFNLETETWSKQELKGESNEIPKTRKGHTTNVVGNYIFIIGGWGKFLSDKNVYKVDFDTQKCQIIGEIIDPVNGSTADIHNQSIYIFGGQNMKRFGFTSELQKFNLLTNECEVIQLVGYQPLGRCFHRSIITQDSLYIFGGYSSKPTTYFQDMFTIDLSNYVSTKIDQHGVIPSPRAVFSFFAFEDKLYLFGGESADGYCQDFYAFDLKSSSWQPQETKNQKCLNKRAYHSTVAIKESSHKLKVYLVGGKDESLGSIQKNMNVLTLSSNRIYWILHYLESTDIHYLPGLNLVQEIIELFE